MEQREDLALVAFHQLGIRSLIPIGLSVLHAIFLAETLNLPVTEHWQTGHGDHQNADAEIFIIFTKLLDGGIFVGIVHEVDVTF